jgi:hypothetical protein
MNLVILEKPPQMRMFIFVFFVSTLTFNITSKGTPNDIALRSANGLFYDFMNIGISSNYPLTAPVVIPEMIYRCPNK